MDMQDFGAGRLTRRQFVKSTAAAAASAAFLTTGNFAYAAGSDRLRVGLVGCGGRGKGAARDAVVAADGVELVALADVFPDRIEEAKRDLQPVLGEAYQVTDDHVYV